MWRNSRQPYTKHHTIHSDWDYRRKVTFLVKLGKFQKALDVIDTDDAYLQRQLLEEMLRLAERADWSPNEMDTGYREVLVRLISSDVVINFMPPEDIFDSLVRIYFPHFARDFWETFIVYGRGRINKNEFLTEMVSAVKLQLLELLTHMDTDRRHNQPDELKKHRELFGQLVLTAVKPLQCDSVSCCDHDSDDESALFSQAVSQGLLSEAVLLYDTGSVCPKELAALAQDRSVQKMLKGDDDNSPMAVFFRQVVNQPPSLKPRCRIHLAGRLGEDLKGKLDRARSLGLPTTLCESLVNLHQTKQYMRSVNEEYANSVKKNEAETVNKKNETDSTETDSDSDDFQALSQLIDF